MRDETRLMQIDRMIDEVISVSPGTGQGHATADGPLSPDQFLVHQLRGLGTIEWPADDVGDRIARAVTGVAGRAHPAAGLESGDNGRNRRSRHRRPRRAMAATLAVAAIILLAFVVARATNGPSSSGRPGAPGPVSTASLRMRLVDSTASPFQSVGAGPQSGDLVCVTATVCYADDTNGGSRVERTADGGATWQATAALPENEQFTAWPLACPTTDVCVGAVSVNGIPTPGSSGLLQLAATGDGGGHWSIEDLTAPTGMTGATIDQVSCATAQRCVAYVLGQSAASSAPAGIFLFTTDGGTTWTPASATTSTQAGLFTLKCDPDDSCIGLAPTGSVQDPATEGIDALRSTDDGRTWTTTSSPLSFSAGILLMSCGDTLHCMLAYPAPGGGAITIATTADGGATWRVTAAPSTWPTIAISVSCATGQDCFVSAASSTSQGGYQDPVIEATHDGGIGWAPLALPAVDGSPLALVYPLSCPVAVGCIGVGATPQEFNGPVSVPVTLPASGWVRVGQRVIISNLPAAAGS